MDTGLGAKAYAIIEQGKIGMILSSRPTDRRQLIEEAAGITKYKARRRSAELKLEAAQQNLTRLEDIVYEIDKQRGSLKRQAAKARRYTRLRDEMRRWEKVLFARRYRSLSDAIETARTRLHDARTNEAAASARLAEVENELGRIRIELATADTAATQARETVHAHELEINRRQQQIALDTQQAEMLMRRAEELEAERQQLEARREPEQLALEGRRLAATKRPTRATKPSAVAAAAAEEYTAGVDGDRSARAGRREGARRRLCGAQHHHGADRRARFGRGAARARDGNPVAPRDGSARTGRRARTARARSAWRRPKRCIARRKASIPRGSAVPRANRNSPPRASSTNGARARSGRASRTWPA